MWPTWQWQVPTSEVGARSLFSPHHGRNKQFLVEEEQYQSYVGRTVSPEPHICPGTSYLQMSLDDKLNVSIIHEMDRVKHLMQQVQQQQGQLSQLNEITESVQTEIIQMNHTASQQQQLRITELEARSHHNNVLFVT